MAFNIDEWIPNFTFFVFYLAPLILSIVFVMIILSRWFRIGKPKKRMDFAQMLGLIPALYLIQPIWEMGEYLNGTRSEIADRLLLWHFPIFMFLVLCVGIGQVGYYWISMGDAGEVKG